MSIDVASVVRIKFPGNYDIYIYIFHQLSQWQSVGDQFNEIKISKPDTGSRFFLGV